MRSRWPRTQSVSMRGAGFGVASSASGMIRSYISPAHANSISRRSRFDDSGSDSLLLLVLPVMSASVPSAPTIPAVLSQQARECTGLTSSRISYLQVFQQLEAVETATSLQQQIIAPQLARAGCRTAIRDTHA
jgi:hypothetical protein